jgi:hypothetical protein
MQRNIALLLACLLTIFVLQFSVASSYPYTPPNFIVKNTTTTSSPMITHGVSLYTNESCSTSLLQKVTTNSNTYTIDNTLYSITGADFIHGTLNNQASLTCKTLQILETGNTAGGYYGGYSSIQTITSNTKSILTSNYSCETTGNTISFAVDPFTDTDVFGNVPNRLAVYNRHYPDLLFNATDYVKAENYNTCESGFENHAVFSNNRINSLDIDGEERVYFYYPFNSTGGRVNYSFYPSPSVGHLTFCGFAGDVCSYGANTPTMNFRVYLYDTSSDSLQVLDSYSQDCGSNSTNSQTFSGTLNLGINNQNKLYYFIVEEFLYAATNGTGFGCDVGISMEEPASDISIYTYRGNYQCSETSGCHDGTKTLFCTDLNNIAPNETFYDPTGCFEFANQSINLGFDNFYTMDTFYCQNVFSFGFLCEPTALKRDRLYPTGWNIPNRTVTSSVYGTAYLYDMITLTNEKNFPDSTQPNGLSLKMWYTPRKSWLPTFNGTGSDDIKCNATNEGRLPSLWYNNIDSAFFISHNFTALSPYMGLSYRVVRCEDAMLQGTSAPLCGYINYGCNASLFGKPLGSEDYYTYDGCQYPSNQKLPSRMVTQIVDLTSNTSKSITLGDNTNPSIPINSYDFAVDKSYRSPDYMEHEINNMNINHTYEVRFALSPVSDLNDLSPYCLYLDDVNIIFREQAPPCNVRKCFTDYDNNGIPDYSFEEDIESAGGCTPIITPMSLNCVPSSKAAEVIAIKAGTAGKNYTCLPGSVMAMYDTAKDYWSFATNSSVCVAEEAAANASTGVIDALAPFAEGLQASGLGFFLIFLSPIFWGFIIAIGIGAYVGYKSKIAEIGVITILGILIIEAMPQFGIFPPWFIIIFIVIAGFIAVDYLKRKFTGQNN